MTAPVADTSIHVAVPPEDVEPFVDSFFDQGCAILRLHLEDVTCSDALFDRIGDAFHFPLRRQPSPGVIDWMSDLEWLRFDGGHLLVVTGLDELPMGIVGEFVTMLPFVADRWRTGCKTWVVLLVGHDHRDVALPVLAEANEHLRRLELNPRSCDEHPAPISDHGSAASDALWSELVCRQQQHMDNSLMVVNQECPIHIGLRRQDAHALGESFTTRGYNVVRIDASGMTEPSQLYKHLGMQLGFPEARCNELDFMTCFWERGWLESFGDSVLVVDGLDDLPIATTATIANLLPQMSNYAREAGRRLVSLVVGSRHQRVFWPVLAAFNERYLHAPLQFASSRDAVPVIDHGITK